MRLGNYINEVSKKGLGITFIDIDETMFKTFAKINVIKDGKIIKSLTNAEYNHYKPSKGETFDFEEFRDAKLFYETSKPIKKMIDRIIRMTSKSLDRGSKFIFLTARADFDDKDIFLETFKKEGIPINDMYVERAGNTPDKGTTIPLKKKNIILKYLKSGLYRRVRIFDDYINTCKEFLEIKNDLPKEVYDKIREKYNILDIPNENVITFTSYLVDEDGNIKEIK